MLIIKNKDGCRHEITGYCDSTPYLKMEHIYAVDGIGIKHLNLTAVCDKCNERIVVAQTHLRDYDE
jgi:hypothetical protein